MSYHFNDSQRGGSSTFQPPRPLLEKKYKLKFRVLSPDMELKKHLVSIKEHSQTQQH